MGNNFALLLDGFQTVFTPTNLMFGLLGTFLGTLVGVLPGIGPALAIGLLLPITLTVNPTSALIMFAAIFYGAMYGGSTTSILLNTPGESGSVITALEGNKMAKAGRAGAALATAAIGSFVAGLIATILLAFGAPVLAEFALTIQPAGYLALIILAFATVGTLLGTSRIRGLIALSMGLVIGLIGADLQSGALRLTFGNLNAIDGIETVTVIVAIFALGETLYLASRHTLVKASVLQVNGKAWMTREDFRRSPTFLSYGVEKALSKNKDEFGKGAIEGVAGPEAANNANAAGVLVPMLALGLPTSATAAVVLVAFQSFNIQPGPMLFQTNPEIVWSLIASLFVGNFLLLVLNLPLIRFWVMLLKIPSHYLYAGITTFSLLGAYALNNSTFDLQVALVVGVIGFLFRRFGVPITPLIIGAILGPLSELYFKRSLQISQGDWAILIDGTFPKVIYGILILVIIGPLVWNFKKTFAIKK